MTISSAIVAADVLIRSIPKIVRDERVARGQEVALAEALVSVRDVLGGLLSASPEEVVRNFSHRATQGSRAISLDDVQSASSYGSAIASSEELSPTGQSYFAELRGVKGDIALEDVRAIAPRVLAVIGQGFSQDEILRSDSRLTPSLVRASILYAITLVLEERFPPLVPEPVGDRALRSRLPLHDQTLLDNLCHFRSRDTPEKQLAGWEGVVLEVERGFDNIAEEYLLALSNRDDLDEVLSLVSPTAQVQLRAEVVVWDQRFESATETIAEPLLGRGRWATRWYWYRLPILRGGKFVSGLQAMNVDFPVNECPPSLETGPGETKA